jgi:hypothetical protein
MCLISVLLVRTLPEYSIVVFCGSTPWSSCSFLFRSLILSVVNTATRMSFDRVVSLTFTMKLGGGLATTSPPSAGRTTLCRRSGEDCVTEE